MQAVINVKDLIKAIDEAIDYYDNAIIDSTEKYKALFEEEVQRCMKNDWFNRSYEYWSIRISKREWVFDMSIQAQSGLRRNVYNLSDLNRMKENIKGIQDMSADIILDDKEIQMLSRVTKE